MQNVLTERLLIDPDDVVQFDDNTLGRRYRLPLHFREADQGTWSFPGCGSACQFG